ncbi:hypothetical protein [Mesorhizobium shangrilense]|uniref:Transposase n=1 Tax=Mesorhizobium shangrilense TaxID=460060 RepID=A0ABV2DSQ1_9HYPH
MSVWIFAAFESHVNLGGSLRQQLDESDILDDVGKQSLAFAVWCIRPELVESTVIAISRRGQLHQA